MQLKTITMPKSDITATIDILGLEHLAQVLALHDDSRAALPDTQKLFLLPQTSDYFRPLLSQETGVMIGVRANGQLIAQIALKGTMNLAEAIAQHAITRNDINFYHAQTHESVVIAESMAVHPAWNNQDLDSILLEAFLALPQARMADHVFARISAQNTPRWEMFVRAGFGVIAAGLDPVDSKARFIVQKPALGFALHDQASAYDLDPITDFAAIARMTAQEGLVGLLDDNTALLSFYAGLDRAASWTETPASIA